MLEGKFGNRSEALVPRLKELVVDAAEKCAEGSSLVAPCLSNDYNIITPGWSLALGITAVRGTPLCIFIHDVIHDVIYKLKRFPQVKSASCVC